MNHAFLVPPFGEGGVEKCRVPEVPVLFSLQQWPLVVQAGVRLTKKLR